MVAAAMAAVLVTTVGPTISCSSAFQLGVGLESSHGSNGNFKKLGVNGLKLRHPENGFFLAVENLRKLRKNRNVGFHTRAGLDEVQEKTQTEIENEEFVDKAMDSPEGTAAATVALRAEEMSAVDKVVDVVKEIQKQEVVADSAIVSKAKSSISEELAAIYANCKTWKWRGHSINYVSQGSGPAVLLVHGFGASIGHWRKNIGVLAKFNSVYAVDLLGFGASDKPTGFQYTMENWAEACSHPLSRSAQEQVAMPSFIFDLLDLSCIVEMGIGDLYELQGLLTDFLKEVVGSPAVLIGNSIGSLACLITSSEAPAGMVRATVLINCAGGMNNKAVTDDWRLKLLLPILWLIDFILSIPSLATRLFARIKSSENIKNVLRSVYNNKDAVDDELVEVIRTPADDSGALNAFITINSGPPGPKPQILLPKISHPVLVIWGDDDPFTPLDGPVGKWITAYASSSPNVQLHVLSAVGHCPQDDRPELLHEKLIPWLSSVNSLSGA